MQVYPDGTDWPDLSGLAENGLALLVPTGQTPAAMPMARLDMPPYGHPKWAVERVDHLFSHKLGVELPDVLTIALDDPAMSLTDALSAEKAWAIWTLTARRCCGGTSVGNPIY